MIFVFVWLTSISMLISSFIQVAANDIISLFFMAELYFIHTDTLWPWSTKWSRAKANRFCQENVLVIANTLFQQHKRRLCTWTSPDGQHRNQIDYILCSQRWKSSIQSARTRLGADCGSDQELLIARLKLKKVLKNNRQFMDDINHIH